MRQYLFGDSLELLPDRTHVDCAGLSYHTDPFYLSGDCDPHCKTTQGPHAGRDLFRGKRQVEIYGRRFKAS